MSAPPAPAEAHLLAVHSEWAPFLARHEPFPVVPSHAPDPYASLIRAVVHQQLSGKAAGTILGRVLALFPETPPPPDALAAMPDEKLRAAGLSRQKIASLKDIARLKLSGVIPEATLIADLPDEEIIARLSQARGVGRWTVEMHLIFAMGRPDVLPIDDLGVRKGAERVFGRPFKPKELAEFGAAWAPWRSAAAWHCWRAMEAVAESLAAPPKT